MTLPPAENVTSSPVDEVPVMRTCTLLPRTSAIWEAIVRFQISS